MSSLAPWLLNHSGSSLGCKELARKRFIPQYPINILTGTLTEVSVVIQALHSAWWPGMRCWLVCDVDRFCPSPLPTAGRSRALTIRAPLSLAAQSAVVHPWIREGEPEMGHPMSCRALQRGLLGWSWLWMLFPGQFFSSWLATF